MSGRLDVSRSAAESSKDRVVADINKLVGLGPIKNELNKLIAFGELIKLRRSRDIPMEKIGLHMVFKGPPGTGKTILARKFGELFKSIGLLRESKLIEVDRSTIIGTALGDTEKKMRDAFDRARNGVLFIDEAYALAGISAEDISKDQHDVFGKAAVDTLLKLMEDNRASTAVIVAGYPEPMDRFLNSNAGLKSRFAKTFTFAAFTHDELLQVFKDMAEEWHYTLEDDAITEARRFILTELDVSSRDFGNAREIRRFLEAILPVQAERLSVRIATTVDVQTITDTELLTITAADVQGAIATYEKV